MATVRDSNKSDIKNAFSSPHMPSNEVISPSWVIHESKCNLRKEFGQIVLHKNELILI